MKHLFKTTRFLLALCMASGVFVSCVEDEQAPFTDETGSKETIDVNKETIDVKLPYPGSTNIYVGSEVVMKGSGFSEADKVYVQKRNDSYSEDSDYPTENNNEKVEARISQVTDSELTFIIPSEMDPSKDYNYEINVFYVRNGQEYKIGTVGINNYIHVNQQLFGEDGNIKFTLGGDINFSQNDKVYLSYYTINENTNNIELTGEKIEVDIINITENSIEASFSGFITSEELKVIYEHNGEESIVGDIRIFDFHPSISISNNGTTFMEGDKVCLLWNGFEANDEIFLKNRSSDNRSIKAEIIDRNAESITIIIPSNISDNDYYIILKRDGAEVQLSLDNGSNLHLYPEHPEYGKMVLSNIGGSALNYRFTETNRDGEIEQFTSNNQSYTISKTGNELKLITDVYYPSETENVVLTANLNENGFITTVTEDGQTYTYAYEGTHLASISSTGDFSFWSGNYQWSNDGSLTRTTITDNYGYQEETEYSNGYNKNAGGYNLSALLTKYPTEIQQILALLGYAGTAEYLPADINGYSINYIKITTNSTMRICEIQAYDNYTLEWNNR